jgi:hypothetical protein
MDIYHKENLLVKALLWLYNIYAMLLFVLLMLIIFPFVLLASFMGPVRGGNVIYRICMLWGDIWFPLVGIIHKNIYESPGAFQIVAEESVNLWTKPHNYDKRAITSDYIGSL